MEPLTTDNKITVSDAREANEMHERIIGSLKMTAKEMIALGEYLCAIRSTKKRGDWSP